MANTRKRDIRIADETWALAQRRAEREGTNVSAAVRTFLEQYAGQPVNDKLAEQAAQMDELASELRRMAVAILRERHLQASK